MSEKLTPRQERAALEGLYGNQGISVHDRLLIGKQLINYYREEAIRLRAWYITHLSPECATVGAHDGCDETVVCKSTCWCSCHHEGE